MAVIQSNNLIAEPVVFFGAIIGFTLSGWQKIAGDREQKQQLEQEQKRTEAVAEDRAIHSTQLRTESNLFKAP